MKVNKFMWQLPAQADASVTRLGYIVAWRTHRRAKFLRGAVARVLERFLREESGGGSFGIQRLTIGESWVVLVVTLGRGVEIFGLIRHLKYQSAVKLKMNFPGLAARFPAIWTRDEYVRTWGGESVDLSDELNKFLG